MRNFASMPAAHHRISQIAIAAVMLFLAIVSARSIGSDPGSVIRSDAKGYYAYLPALFIAHDLGREQVAWEYVHVTPKGTLNKYFAGVAVMQLPFFLAAHAWVKATHGVADGYSPPYAYAIAVAALVYALLGLMAFRALLLRLGVKDGHVALLALVLGFGTQLAQYTAVQPGWSHAYSFCLFAAFLLLVQSIAEQPRTRRMVACALVFGLIVLARPVNGLVLLAIPVLLGSRTHAFLHGLLRNPRGLVLAVLAAGTVLAVQPLLWYAQVGQLIAYGYKGEGFHWARPAIFQVLFGFRRGLFLWTPVLVPAALCVVLLWRYDRFRAVAAALYWVAVTYVISSWWVWYYGTGFGSRVYVEHYAVLFLPLALMMGRFTRFHQRALGGFLLAATGLHLAQFYQYNHGFLDREGMDSSKYAYSFLRFDEAHRNRMGGRYMSPPYNPHGMDTLVHSRWNAEHPARYWSGVRMHFNPAPSPTHVAACDTSDEFGPSFAMPAGDLPTGRALFLALGFERRVQHVDDSRNVLAVVAVEQPDGTTRQYVPFRMDPLPPAPQQWEHIEYRVRLVPLLAGETVKCYFWNQGRKGRFLVDDLDMTVMAVRPY